MAKIDSGTSTLSDQLVAAIRGRIVSGQYMPEDRLPTFQEIETIFKVSRGVAQMAVERLKKDGFIDPASRQGLFVARHPPHLCRYGIVFPVTHGDPAWSVFDEVLVRESRQLQQVGNIRDFDVFAGTDDYREATGVLNRLRQDVANDRLAGVILTPRCFGLLEQLPLSDPKLPKVLVYSYPGSSTSPIVTGDGNSLINRSLQYLVSQGCKRVAVIRTEGAYSAIGAPYFESNGLVYKKQWLQVVGRGDAAVLGTLIPLLMDYPEDQRPDGLFVLDDNLVDHITSAMVGMGLRIGKDVHMVAHTNWPSRSPNVLPIRRIGYHIGHMLARCVEAIDMQRRGQIPPAVQYMPSLFEDEVGSA